MKVFPLESRTCAGIFNNMLVAILHNIRSLFNVGSIFRTADGAGFSKLYLCGITPTPYDEFKKLRSQMAKVSLGAEKSVAWEKCKSTTAVISRLKKEGYTIIAVEIAKGAIPYFNFKAQNKIALIVGHEVKGLPNSILKLADKTVYIPMHGVKESLNVGVAFGIVAFYFSTR